MPPTAEYGPSTVPWVREEVEHLERTGTGLRGRSVVLLTTVGARSDLIRKTPRMRVENAGVYAAVASMGGAHRHPHWYANAMAEPEITLRDGDRVLELVAREASGAAYVEHQRRARRRIPLLLPESRARPGRHRQVDTSL